MKKVSLLLAMLLAYSFSTMAQGNVPVPADPDVDQFEWYDDKPIVLPNDSVVVTSGWFFISYGMDVMGNLVANDYSLDIDSCFTHTLDYTILDKDKYSYSIYTDWDEIFVFDPAEYSEFTEPTTNVFIFNLENILENGSTPSGNFEYWGPHFPNRTNQVDGIDGMEPFFQWRIGIQAHYTVDGVTTSSNIVYLNVYPKPVTMLGDVNEDGEVNVSDVILLINYLLNDTVDPPFNKFNADFNDDDTHNIVDVIDLINYLLNTV